MTLAPGAARRRALDAALEEIAAGLDAPSPAWRFRFSLMLGLERVLAADQPALLNGLTLRPHQVDALAGMLAALTAGEEREADLDEADDELNGDDPPIDEPEADSEPEAVEDEEEEDEEDEDEEDEDDEDDDEDDEDDDSPGVEAAAADADDEESDDDAEVAAEPEIHDPGAVRRYRFKHPTASG